MSQRLRKRIEEPFGWVKTNCGVAQNPPPQRGPRRQTSTLIETIGEVG
jgi:hypothetical protein